jgi:geranylgeranyl pyrophosphate synthase
VPELIDAIRETGSIQATQSLASSYVEKAKGALIELPESPGRQMLELMADAVIRRSY